MVPLLRQEQTDGSPLLGKEVIGSEIYRRPLKPQGDVGMTLRAVIGACCGMTFVLLASAQAFGVECATEAQRKIEIEKLTESVDWFLSTVEEVPEDIAQLY